MKLATLALLYSALAISLGGATAQAENRLFVAAGDGSQDSGPYAGPATDAGLFGVGDIAVSPDGSFLISIGEAKGMVLRVTRGWVRRVAGVAREGFSGDGGPATRARLRAVHDVAVAADGGFLIADGQNCRIRRVGRDGIIRTVAGSGPTGCYVPLEDKAGPARGDGGPATAARLNAPSAVAALRDGGFLLSEGNRVRRVRPDGTITTVAGTGASGTFGVAPAYGRPATSFLLGSPARLAPTPDGGFLVADANGVHRVRPDGIIVAAGGTDVILSEGGAFYARGSAIAQLVGPLPARDTLIASARLGYFGGFGDPATAAPGLPALGDVEPTPEGGLLFVPDTSFQPRVLYSAPPATSRLGVAVARETLPALLHRRLRFRLTRAARVKVRLYRGRRIAARRAVSGRQGLNTVRLPRRLKRGLHSVRLRAGSSDGAVATDDLRVLVGAWLPKDVASNQIYTGFACFGECGGVEDTIGPCRRFGPRRVDCVIGSIDGDERTPCSNVVSAVLRRSGYLYLRPYRCRRRKQAGYFRARPRQTARAQQAPPL